MSYLKQNSPDKAKEPYERAPGKCDMREMQRLPELNKTFPT